jgi:hypothetical protein
MYSALTKLFDSETLSPISVKLVGNCGAEIRVLDVAAYPLQKVRTKVLTMNHVHCLSVRWEIDVEIEALVRGKLGSDCVHRQIRQEVPFVEK